MLEATLLPPHGLKLAVDCSYDVTFPPQCGIQLGDRARMHMRHKVADPTPRDVLSTENSRITLEEVLPDGSARFRVAFPGEITGAYPLINEAGEALTKSGTSLKLGPGAVYVLTGTLIVTAPNGVDRPGAALDLQHVFEASYTWGTP